MKLKKFEKGIQAEIAERNKFLNQLAILLICREIKINTIDPNWTHLRYTQLS